MELQKNVYEALKKINNYEGLQNFLRVATIKQPNRKDDTRINLYEYVSTDTLRPVMQGVKHDSTHQVAVATNGHILVASTKDYREELADKTMLKDGSFAEGNYPIWSALVKGGGRREPLMEITPEITQMVAKYKSNSRAQLGAKKNHQKVFIAHSLSDGKVVVFDFDLYMKFYKAVKYFGINTVEFVDSQYTNSPQKQLLIAKEENNIAIIVPFWFDWVYTEDVNEVTKPLLIKI